MMSLAQKLGLPSAEAAAEKLSHFLSSLGADLVAELRVFEDLSLLEQQREFVERVRDGTAKRPLLTSACPGWICYAEKTHGSWILPHISRVKSAQQLCGSYVKTRLASRVGRAPGKVAHVTLMPCFDKKLEASRADFASEDGLVKDVDLVITTVEEEYMRREKGVDLATMEESRRLDDVFGGE